MIKVANIKTFVPDHSRAVRVDRRTPLGNPYTLLKEEDRDMVCDKYEKYFYKKLNNTKLSNFKSALAQLVSISSHSDITLLCWCYPKRCHADTIKEYLESVANPKE